MYKFIRHFKVETSFFRFLRVTLKYFLQFSKYSAFDWNILLGFNGRIFSSFPFSRWLRIIFITYLLAFRWHPNNFLWYYYYPHYICKGIQNSFNLKPIPYSPRLKQCIILKEYLFNFQLCYNFRREDFMMKHRQ